MHKHPGTSLALTALLTYILGGILTFSGIILSIRQWFVMGSAGLAYGILLVSFGIILSISGVFFMRVVRNRFKR